MLRQLAGAISESLRQSDHVVRYGGDEFAVLAPGVSHVSAVALAHMLNESVTALALPDGVRQQTLSIGVATLPEDGQTLTALLEAADKRLYAAKAAGRNRVTGATGDGGLSDNG